jgi:hypothetical protein
MEYNKWVFIPGFLKLNIMFLKICLCFSLSQYFISFHDQIVFHSMDIPHFICTFISWKVRLFLLLGYYYYNKCYFMYLHTSFYITGSITATIYRLYVWAFEKFSDSFPKWLHNFTFSLGFFCLCSSVRFSLMYFEALAHVFLKLW